MPDVLTKAYILVNAVALKTKASKVTVNYSKVLYETPVFADTGMRRIAGLADWSITIDFYRDELTSGVIQTLWGLVGVETALKVRAVDTTIAATNAEYQGSGMLGELPVVVAEMTAPAVLSVTFVSSDGVAMVRDTVP